MLRFGILVLVCLVLITILPNLASSMEELKTKTKFLSRHKRNAWQFGLLVQCVEGIDCPLPLWSYQRYNNYGCHCGIGGHGDPLDEIDRCCYNHDMCYDGIKNKYQIWQWIVYFTIYEYTCHEEGKIQCDDVTEWKRELCECDAQAARCFSVNEDSYNLLHMDIDKDRCFYGDSIL